MSNTPGKKPLPDPAVDADAAAGDSEAEHDVVLVHSRTADGAGIRALRSRPGRLEAAELRPLKRGTPIMAGEIISLRERAGSPVLWDVEVVHRDGETHEGPPRVTTASYRRNWDSIFGADEPTARRGRKVPKTDLN